jgi:hypothetical protein
MPIFAAYIQPRIGSLRQFDLRGFGGGGRDLSTKIKTGDAPVFICRLCILSSPP